MTRRRMCPQSREHRKRAGGRRAPAMRVERASGNKAARACRQRWVAAGAQGEGQDVRHGVTTDAESCRQPTEPPATPPLSLTPPPPRPQHQQCSAHMRTPRPPALPPAHPPSHPPTLPPTCSASARKSLSPNTNPIKLVAATGQGAIASADIEWNRRGMVTEQPAHHIYTLSTLTLTPMGNAHVRQQQEMASKSFDCTLQTPHRWQGR